MLLGYVRVSTRDQIEGTSLAEQTRVVKAVAMVKGLDAFDVSIYSDEGVSASVPLAQRPEGKRLLAAARKGDVIVAAKLDRMFRDALDALETFKYCKANGIDLILYDFGHESVVRDGVGKLLFTIITAVAEMERTRIRERVLSGKAAKKVNGGHTGGLAPYGFQIVGRGKDARLEPNPDEQEAVQVIRDTASQLSLSKTCAHLTSLGITNRLGQPFAKTQIKRIMRRAA